MNRNPTILDVTTGTSTFVKQGRFAKTGRLGDTRFDTGAAFFNSGELEVQTGIVEFDRILIRGTATLGGALNLSLPNDYSPELGRSFQIVTADSRIGTFDEVNGNELGEGLIIFVRYAPSSIVLESRVAGDGDGDGDVDLGDCAAFQRCLGKVSIGHPVCEYFDQDGSGIIDEPDTFKFIQEFGGPRWYQNVERTEGWSRRDETDEPQRLSR